MTVPDLQGTLALTDATQVFQNKTIESLILQDPTDTSKKITFNVANQNVLTNSVFDFPQTNLLNSGVANNTLVTELATQTLSSKTLNTPTIRSASNLQGQVILAVDNITGPRTIRFPDADATLLSLSLIHI